jgi:hypothetical protein
MLAGLTGAEELALDKAEGDQLARAVINVNRHYDTVISAKAMDWTRLLMVVGGLYGPRLAALRMRKMAEAAEARRRAQERPDLAVVQ